MSGSKNSTLNNLKREIITTADGSVTIRLPEWDETYHSKHGAVQEAKHVFIQNGLSLFKGRPVSVLEIGFGTGLNAFITLLESNRQKIEYTAIEAFPVSAEDATKLNYPEVLEATDKRIDFEHMHFSAWEKPIDLTAQFTLTKKNLEFQQLDFDGGFDLIYFDAFGYRVQPELWSADIFSRMYKALNPNGILVTYAARTIIRNNMRAAGFVVSKLPGPPGKREMMRAIKGNFNVFLTV